MNKNNIYNEKQFLFIEYLLSKSLLGKKKLPPIVKIADDLGISVPNVREQLATAKLLGLINLQPRTGITILPYDFAPAVTTSLYYAVKTDNSYFEQFSDLRNQIEKAYFVSAVTCLHNKEIEALMQIAQNAMNQLEGDPIKIPHDEHKKFHLKIYKNLKNVFINGIMEAYWDMYEIVGLNTYADITYLQKVWKYHLAIAQAIADNEIKKAYRLLEDHIALIDTRDDVQRSPENANK